MKESDSAEAARRLTTRELEILTLFARGMTVDEVEAECGFTSGEYTTLVHMHNVMEKLQVETLREAVAYALRHRLVDIDNTD